MQAKYQQNKYRFGNLLIILYNYINKAKLIFDVLYLSFIYMAMWRSWIMHQSSNPNVVCSSPAGNKRLAVGRTVSDWICKGFIPLATHFTHPGEKLGTWRKCGLYN